MIELDRVGVRYAEAAQPVLTDVTFAVPDGELWLVIGPTGSGKSTLLKAMNGLVPHFTGGTLTGRVRVDGTTTADAPPRDLAHRVGYVGQVPSAGFVTDSVEDELAYTMENLGVAPAAMRRRVEDVLDLLSLHEVRHRPLATLSSGQQQRVAIGSVLTASPGALVLDEPTSALDPGAAEEVLAALTRLVHDVGLTVILAEHRLERVVQFADRVVTVAGGSASVAEPEVAMAHAPVTPPVVQLGRVAGWEPLPLSVRDARRRAGDLLDRLGPAPPRPTETAAPPGTASPLAVMRWVQARFGSVTALEDVSITFPPGEVVALMGRNGAGKSTLLGLVAGLRPPARGQVLVGGDPPHRLKPRDLIRRVALVPPEPTALLYAESVAAECATADRDAGLEPGSTLATVRRLVPGIAAARHPRDLSEGQRLSLALGVVAAPGPPLLLLDEPTRGLDYPAKAELVALLTGLAGGGHSIVLATHDVELVAEVAHRVVVLAGGEVMADGPAREVVCHTPLFAPQVAKVMAPAEWLTVAEVAHALGAAAPAPAEAPG